MSTGKTEESFDSNLKTLSANLRTMNIGRITAINADNTLEIQLVINGNVRGASVRMPPLSQVPYFTLQGGSSHIIMPLAVGDDCMVFFVERDMTNWRTGRNFLPPFSYRLHDLSDAIALVGLNHSANSIAVPTIITKVGDAIHTGDNERVGNEVHTGNKTQTGDYEQTGNQTVTGNETVTGLLTTSQLVVGNPSGSTQDATIQNTNFVLGAGSDIIIDGVSLRSFMQNHTHTTQSGGGESSTPNNA